MGLRSVEGNLYTIWASKFWKFTKHPYKKAVEEICAQQFLLAVTAVGTFLRDNTRNFEPLYSPYGIILLKVS